MTKYQRTYDELRRVAVKFWPPEIKAIEWGQSIIPILLETQDRFISIIGTGAPTPEALFTIIEAAGISPSLFMKHLVVLTDFGGEMLQRLTSEAEFIFPENKMTFDIRGTTHTYQFREFPQGKINNSTLGIDGKKLSRVRNISNVQKDAIAILIFGREYGRKQSPFIESVLDKCLISDYLGKPTELEKFVRQRYLWVSKITSGAKTNTLGQILQNKVADYIRENLHVDGAEVHREGHLPGVSHARNRETSFDIVVIKDSKYVAVEVSFQETTNSVVERKSGQVRSRYEQIDTLGYKIAYVADGAGNFHRNSALTTILGYSHCTVAFTPSELELLCEFIREYFST